MSAELHLILVKYMRTLYNGYGAQWPLRNEINRKGEKYLQVHWSAASPVKLTVHLV